MEKNDSALYDAFCAKDARFDGRFFVGVSSSKIYCRPICPAKMPKKESCTFFSSAAEAESAGYRPCLLCRPELAPGRMATEVYASPAGLAARMIEEDCSGGESLEQMAQKLGCTGRHLRRMFEKEFHVSPVQYLQTCRLLLAGWISVSNNAGRNVLEVGLSESLIPVLPQVLGRVRDMFDLYCDPEIIYRALFSLNDIREGICAEGIRLPGCFDPFELSVRAILGQQVTVKAAGTLAGI